VNVLVVTAHPEQDSFNFALSKVAVGVLESEGIRVKRSDLYQDGFNPVPGRNDFVSFPSNEPLRLMEAQKACDAYGGMSSDIVTEQEKLIWADLVLLQFPIWWGSYPAILKGWFERVLTYGFSYGREKSLPSKAVVLSVTTGGVSDSDEIGEYRGLVANIANDVFGFMRWEIIEPFIAFGPVAIGNEDRTLMLENYGAFIRQCVVGLA
jgi:NAD(P)H dehydrogenase (quinone)